LRLEFDKRREEREEYKKVTILLSAPFIVFYCLVILAIVGVILIKRFPIGGKGIVGIVSRRKND
jgi:hypothetical protein